MKLSLLTITLFSLTRGDIWPHQEIKNVNQNARNILDEHIVENSSFRSNSPILSTSILPPLRKDPIPWTDFLMSNDGPSKKSSSIVIYPTEATLSNQNDMIEPIVLNTIPPVTTTFASPSGIVSLETRTTEFESLISPVTITGATDGNANIVAIESNDEIASDDTSKKLFLCGSLRNELIVSRPGSGSVFIKGASRVAIIDDAQNSVIVCQPSTNLSPPLDPEERLGTHGMDFDQKSSTLPPTVLFPETPKNRAPIERSSTTVLKDYLVPPYTYLKR
ncbi:uncharacterized protein LOC124952028 [Vespa velutina]|uniref:uncharacterized protein LOC124952028 n=1 Tax=Vespa velutina TaxID=202808 RepID=UPI001FB4255E|nr:uncharacterized protein LOC124952028 [Vespa velutina]